MPPIRQPPISTDMHTAVGNASSQPIRDAILRLKNEHFLRGRWLGTRNYYARDTINRILEPEILHSQLIEYIAASVFLHCFDGWSYLSQATESLINGDAGTAIHLAYYAELRAAMSFLASEGLGIFNIKHYSVDIHNQLLRFRGRTHRVWDVFDAWANHSSNSIRLLQLIEVNNTDLDHWLSAAGSGHQIRVQLAKDWLLTWGIDLEQFALDRGHRNEMSYRPQRLRRPIARHNLMDILRTITDFWRACQPSRYSNCEEIDLHLLRQALRKVDPGIGGHGRFIDATLNHLSMANEQHLRDFLYSGVPRHAILAGATYLGINGRGEIRPISVICRAILLLRLASAACDSLFRESGLVASDMEFWWKELGSEIGLWESGSEPYQMFDLWADIEFRLDTIEDWLDSADSANAGINSAMKDHATDLWHFERFQRVGLWAMGL